MTYTYGNPGSQRPHAVIGTSGADPAPDRSFLHNDDNKPSSITFLGDNNTFKYSGVWSSHNRAEKTTTAATTVYVNRLYEKTGSNSTKYIFAGGTRVAVINSTGAYYYHQDHLGSTRVVTDSSSANVEEIHYYPYGETLDDNGDDPGKVNLKHKFTSQELDSETGLYYYGARCYDPVLGRFTTADTIVPDPTNPQALNRYSYVKNNPLKYTNPTGHGWFKKRWRKLRRWFRRIFRPKKVIKQTIKQTTTFSLKNVVETGVNAALASHGIDPNGIVGTTIKSVANYGTSQLTNKAYQNSGRSRRNQTDRGSPAITLASPPTPFTNKDGSQHVPGPSRANHGLVDSNPYLSGEYDTEDAVWRLVLAIKSEGGFKQKEVRMKSDLIVVPSDGVKASVRGAIFGGVGGAIFGYLTGGPINALWNAYLGANRGAVFGLGYHIYKEEYRYR